MPAGDRGSATAELVIVTPVLLALMMFVVYCGRMADSRMRLEDAAHQAVRAATLARSPGGAVADARTAAQDALKDAGITCRSLKVDADVGALEPGDTVSVTVACVVSLDDLALLNLPGTASLDARSSAQVDVFRGTGGEHA